MIQRYLRTSLAALLIACSTSYAAFTYDTYTDSGSSGIDRIVAVGTEDVDLGLADGNFLANNGIEQIVNTATRNDNGVITTARLRLLGNWSG